MSRSFRLVFCLALVLLAPMAMADQATSSAGCSGAVEASFGPTADPVTGLPTTVLEAASHQFWECPREFETASWCYQCHWALSSCSGDNCYFCSEICLARLGCWVP